MKIKCCVEVLGLQVMCSIVLASMYMVSLRITVGNRSLASIVLWRLCSCRSSCRPNCTCILDKRLPVPLQSQMHPLSMRLTMVDFSEDTASDTCASSLKSARLYRSHTLGYVMACTTCIYESSNVLCSFS